MAVMRRVGTFDLAQLASVAQVDDAFLLGRRQRSHVAVVAIDRVEQRRKRRAKIEAQAAAVTDVEDALDFLVESGAVPILRLGRIIGEAVGRPDSIRLAINLGAAKLRLGSRVERASPARQCRMCVRRAGSAIQARAARRCCHARLPLERGLRLGEAPGVRLLGLRESFEPVCDFREALFARRLRHPGIHVGVLVRLAMDGGFEIQHRIAHRQAGRRIANLLQIVEMTMRVTGLAFGGVAKQPGDFRLAFDVGNLGEIEIAAIGLALAGERVLEILWVLVPFRLAIFVLSLSACVVCGGLFFHRNMSPRQVAAKLWELESRQSWTVRLSGWSSRMVFQRAILLRLPDDNYYHPARATVKPREALAIAAAGRRRHRILARQ